MTGRVTSTGRVSRRTGVLVGWDDDYVCRPDHYALCRRNFLDYRDVTVGVLCPAVASCEPGDTCASGHTGDATGGTRLKIEAMWMYLGVQPHKTARLGDGTVLTMAVPPPPPVYMPSGAPDRMTVAGLIQHLQGLDPMLPVVLIGDTDLSGPVTRKHVVAGVLLDIEEDGVVRRVLAITPEDGTLYKCFGKKQTTTRKQATTRASEMP